MGADVFTLEALEAKYGDSLLLHYGDFDDPRLIVIDGGPATVYADALRPRLDAIQKKRGGGQLEIRMLMVSHIDLDHINGVLKLTEALRKDLDAKRPLPLLSATMMSALRRKGGNILRRGIGDTPPPATTATGGGAAVGASVRRVAGSMSLSSSSP